jgi:hypothetical protein
MEDLRRENRPMGGSGEGDAGGDEGDKSGISRAQDGAVDVSPITVEVSARKHRPVGFPPVDGLPLAARSRGRSPQYSQLTAQAVVSSVAAERAADRA